MSQHQSDETRDQTDWMEQQKRYSLRTSRASVITFLLTNGHH